MNVPSEQAQPVSILFRRSFDKANRSSIKSFRGIGIDTGLEPGAIRKEVGAPVLTDVHEIAQAGPVAEVADVLQILRLCRRRT
jgi:2-dehydro-3-deoxyphosphooctonate aldolase (KDO 8-P synthase)